MNENKKQGWILSFYSDGNNEINREEFPYLSWSPYDRVEINKVEQFSRFFESQFNVRWDGIAQQLHLISEYPENFNWIVTPTSEDKNVDTPLIRTNKKDYGLNCIVTTRYSKGIRDGLDFKNTIYKTIDKVLSSEETYKSINIE